jgi:hypothetical protein
MIIIKIHNSKNKKQKTTHIHIYAVSTTLHRVEKRGGHIVGKQESQQEETKND